MSAGRDGQAEAISLAASMGLAAGQAIDAITEAQKVIDALDPTDRSDRVVDDLGHAQQVLATSRVHGAQLIESICTGQACEQPP